MIEMSAISSAQRCLFSVQPSIHVLKQAAGKCNMAKNMLWDIVDNFHYRYVLGMQICRKSLDHVVLL